MSWLREAPTLHLSPFYTSRNCLHREVTIKTPSALSQRLLFLSANLVWAISPGVSITTPSGSRTHLVKELWNKSEHRGIFREPFLPPAIPQGRWSSAAVVLPVMKNVPIVTNSVLLKEQAVLLSLSQGGKIPAAKQAGMAQDNFTLRNIHQKTVNIDGSIQGSC